MKVGSGGNLSLSREYSKKLFGPMFYSCCNCPLRTHLYKVVGFINSYITYDDFTHILPGKKGCLNSIELVLSDMYVIIVGVLAIYVIFLVSLVEQCFVRTLLSYHEKS